MLVHITIASNSANVWHDAFEFPPHAWPFRLVTYRVRLGDEDPLSACKAVITSGNRGSLVRGIPGQVQCSCRKRLGEGPVCSTENRRDGHSYRWRAISGRSAHWPLWRKNAHTVVIDRDGLDHSFDCMLLLPPRRERVRSPDPSGSTSAGGPLAM